MSKIYEIQGGSSMVDIAPIPHGDPAVAILEAVIRRLENRIEELEEWQEAFSSPLYWRILLWFHGYRFRRMGRWYGTEDM